MEKERATLKNKQKIPFLGGKNSVFLLKQRKERKQTKQKKTNK